MNEQERVYEIKVLLPKGEVLKKDDIRWYTDVQSLWDYMKRRTGNSPVSVNFTIEILQQ